MKAKIEISLEVTKIDAENGVIEGKFYATEDQVFRADDCVIIAAVQSLMSHMQVELQNHPRKGLTIGIFTEDGGDLCSSDSMSGRFQVLNVENGTEVWLGGDEFVKIGEK